MLRIKKKKTLNEGIIGDTVTKTLSKDADRLLGKGVTGVLGKLKDKAVGSIKNKLNTKKIEKANKIRYSLGELDSSKVIVAYYKEQQDNEMSQPKSLLIHKKGNVYYVSIPLKLTKLPKESEAQDKYIDSYKKGNYFLPCLHLKGIPPKEFKGLDESNYIYEGGNLEITLDNEDADFSMYDKSLKREFIVDVTSYKIISYNEVNDVISKYVGLEEYLREYIKGKDKVYKFNYTSQELYKQSHKNLEKIINDNMIDSIKFVTEDDMKMVFTKKGDKMYTNLLGKDRPSLLTDNGIVVAFM